MVAGSAVTSGSLLLLDVAVDYTWRALTSVTDDRLGAPTPCAQWDLRDLLRHMDDSLAAFTEAADVGRIELSPRATDCPADELVRRLERRACSLLDAWHDVADGSVLIGAGALDPDAVAGIGALEITVHGWDVARTTGLEHPIPAHLATRLLHVARDVVGEADRPGRFAPAVPTTAADPGPRLVAHLGREPTGR